MTAYKAGDYIDMGVHSTIINETKWREVVIRTSMLQEYNVNYTKYCWALWHAVIREHSSALIAGNETVPRGDIYVLLELPTVQEGQVSGFVLVDKMYELVS